jgi:hypothetical protein
VTLAVAGEIPVALAVMTVEPGATPVTGTLTFVAPAAIEIDAGTVATPVWLDARLTVSPPAGAGPDSTKVRGRVAVPEICKVAG